MRRRAKYGLGIAAGMLLAAGLHAADPVPPPSVPAPQTGNVLADAARVSWTYSQNVDAVGAGLGVLEISIDDAGSGQPLRVAPGQLAVWMQRRQATLAAGETSCADNVRALASQGVGRRAAIDLNGYRLLTLNTDQTLAVINPFVGLNNAKLESIVELPGPPLGWLVLPERMEAWVLLGAPGRLVGIDLHARRITHTLALPGGAIGRELAYDPAQRRLWLALADSGQIMAIDPAAPASAMTVVTSSSTHLRATPAGLFALGSDASVAMFRSDGPARHWRLVAPAGAAQFSELARRLIVAQQDGGLVWLDPQANAGELLQPRLRLAHPAHALALFDAGRYALALGGGQASVVDLAQTRVVATLTAPEGADRIVLTNNYAYAVAGRSGQGLLWKLGDLREGRDQPVQVTLGPPDPAQPTAMERPGVQRAQTAPAGNGILVANMRDGRVYQYGEGMMAPVGTYSNYSRAALGLAVLDLSPREITTGRFRATIRYEQGGPHELVLSGVAPRFAVCAPLLLPAVHGNVAAVARRMRVELAGVHRLTTANAAQIKVRMYLRGQDGPDIAMEGVRDLTLQAFNPRNGWQERVALREAAPGLYQAELHVPGPGPYQLHASSISRDLAFAAGRVGMVQLGDPP